MLAESRLPTHDALVADLRLVRERGLGNLRYFTTPALNVACALYGAGDDDIRRPTVVEALLRKAVDDLGGGRPGEAAGYTFGLVQGTKLWSATDRRKAAAKAQGVSVERFRKGYEGVLIGQVAEGVLAVLCNLDSQDDASEVSLADAADGSDGLVTPTGADGRLAAKLAVAGVTEFHFSRSDYGTTLAQFLDQAQSSITMVSMSLKTKGAENEIAQVFRRSLAKSPQFRIIVSLIKPDSPACQAAAVILGVSYDNFAAEIASMLTELARLRDSLPVQQASRFYILQHVVIPSFSVILLDDGLPSATLQTEAKFYDEPRSDSYGFMLAPRGELYQRHRLSYYRILRDADIYPEGAERPVLPIEV